jgi:hypothetical protein
VASHIDTPYPNYVVRVSAFRLHHVYTFTADCNIHPLHWAMFTVGIFSVVAFIHWGVMCYPVRLCYNVKFSNKTTWRYDTIFIGKWSSNRQKYNITRGGTGSSLLIENTRTQWQKSISHVHINIRASHKGKLKVKLSRRIGEWTYNSTVLDLGTTWKWVVSFMSQSLYSRGNSSRYLSDTRPHGPHSLPGRCGEEKNLALPGIEHQP